MTAASEHRWEPSGAGTVMVDVGDHRGALVVHSTAAHVDEEIEIRPVGGGWSGEHVAVRRRSLLGAASFAGLFPSLEAGSYEIRWRPVRADGVVQVVSVVAGSVTDTALGSA